MTKFITIIFLFITLTGFSQTLFDYEKEIDNKADFNFIEIEFENKLDKIKLSGTLITPKSDFDKIVVIVPGSGKDTRHSHYVLAEELLKKNIAVYRFDERGIGLSGGKYSESAKSLASDLQFAFKELQSKYSTKKIGILGHSLGGLAALKVIKANTIPGRVNFVFRGIF